MKIAPHNNANSQRDALLVACRAEGMSWSRIARLLGCAVTTARMWGKQAGATLPPDTEREDQLYRWVRQFEHMSLRRNRVTTMVEWEALCADCGLPFKALTTLAFKSVRRRCTNCQAARVPTRRRAIPLWPEGSGGEKDAPSWGPATKDAENLKHEDAPASGQETG